MIDWLVNLVKDLNLWVCQRVSFGFKAEAVLLVKEVERRELGV